MTYPDTIAWLDTWTNYETRHQPQAMRAVKLERMAQLCRLLGDPQRWFRSVLIGGTNGKGAMAAMLYAMLREGGLRAGLYTSPHLEHMRERIRVSRPPEAAGDRITEEQWAEAARRVRPAAETIRLEHPGDPPTYFELLTAMALVHFQQQGVQVAVLEVGLGGRLDATNVVTPAVTLLGPIDYDHTDVLGQSLDEIAYEKAGIIKPGQTLVSAPQAPAAEDVIRAAAEAQGVPLLTCDVDFHATIQEESLHGLRASITGARSLYEDLTIPLIGRHQAQNAAMAAVALELLSGGGVPAGLVARGLSKVRWPGRLEVAREQPLVLLDGAHNPHAARALAAALAQHAAGRPIHFLVGMSADKDAQAFGSVLGPLAASMTCTRTTHARACDPAILAQRFYPFCHEMHVMADPVDAYTYLLNAVGGSDVIVVTGSLFLVGTLRSALRRAAAQCQSRRPALPAAVQEP